MAVKARVARLERRLGISIGPERRENLELIRSVTGTDKSIEELHKEVPLTFRGLVSILEGLRDRH